MSGSIIPSTERRWRAALLLAAVIAALCFAVDVRSTLCSGAVDLRSRVVGARVWLAGRDPYSHKWQPGMPDTWLDPMDLTPLRASRVGVPPPVLVLHAPFARLRYLYQRIGWLIVQWLLFLAALALFSRLAPSAASSRLVLIGGILLIAPSYAWRLHVERGQIHVLWPFLVALAATCFRRPAPPGPPNVGGAWGGRDVLGGAIIGFAAALRPPLGLILLPMGLRREWKVLAGGGIGLLVGLLLPLAVGGLSSWKSYSSAMGIHCAYHAGRLADPVGLEQVRRVRGQWPPEVEGEATEHLARALNIPCVDSSLQGTAGKLFGIALSPRVLFVILGLCVVLLGLVFVPYAGRGDGLAPAFLWGTVIALVAEFLIPAQRYSYNNLTWLPPLCLALAQADPAFLRRSRLHALPVLGLLIVVAAGWSEGALLANEVLVTLYLVALAWQVIMSGARRRRRPVPGDPRSGRPCRG